MKTRKSLRKDKRGFTGLEAAIVLTAFVVVAAVFSYVVLNAGFFTTQKAKEVVHTGVDQATSSLAVAGNVVGYGWEYNTTVAAGNITLETYDNTTNDYTHANTLISDSVLLYATLSGTFGTGGYLNVSVNYTNKAGTSDRIFVNFSTNDEELKKTLSTSIYDVTNITRIDFNNLTAGSPTVTIKAPQNGTYYVSYTNTKDSTNLTAVKLYLALTAGQNPIDLDTLIVSYMDRDTQVGALTYVELIANATKGNMPMGCWNYTFADTEAGTANNLLETNEVAIIVATLPNYGVTVNKPFTIELKPASGATLGVFKNAPSGIDQTMNLH